MAVFLNILILSFFTPEETLIIAESYFLHSSTDYVDNPAYFHFNEELLEVEFQGAHDTHKRVVFLIKEVKLLKFGVRYTLAQGNKTYKLHINYKSKIMELSYQPPSNVNGPRIGDSDKKLISYFLSNDQPDEALFTRRY